MIVDDQQFQKPPQSLVAACHETTWSSTPKVTPRCYAQLAFQWPDAIAMADGFENRVKARPPRSPELTPSVRSVWTYSSRSNREFELVMPGGGGQFLINLFEDELRHWTGPEALGRRIGPLGLQGALTRPVVIDTDQKRDICGVAFHPGGLAAFCNWSAQNFTDTIVDAVEVFGEAANALRETLLRTSDSEQRLDRIESFMLGRLQRQPKEDHLVVQIVNELAQGMSVSDVRARHGLSQRRLHDLFDRRIGLRPKPFARLERFATALDALPDRASWSDLALAHGFADQAHFIREFQQISGELPSRHAALPGEPRHARSAADKTFNTRGAA